MMNVYRQSKASSGYLIFPKMIMPKSIQKQRLETSSEMDHILYVEQNNEMDRFHVYYYTTSPWF